MIKKNIFYFVKKLLLKKLRFTDPLLENKIRLLDEMVFNRLKYDKQLTEHTKNINLPSSTFLTLSVKCTLSSTLVSATTSSGNPLFSFSSGLVGLKGKLKVDRQKAITGLLIKAFRTLESVNLGKNIPISLHLINVGKSTIVTIETTKILFLVVSIKSLERPPYNGCRKKKMRRKKVVNRAID